MPRSRFIPATDRRGQSGLLARVVLLLTALTLSWPAVAHPQDGPHADLRIAIEDSKLRFSIGVNLVFMDSAIDTTREAVETVSQLEREHIEAGWRRWIREDLIVRIDDEVIEPRFDFVELFADPDPGMAALFPVSGLRGAIRMVSLVDYPAESPPQRVEITWPHYPEDVLAQIFEAEDRAPGESSPKMVFETQVKADGKLAIARFSEAEPTLVWTRGNETEDVLASLPAIPQPVPPVRVPALSIALGAAGALALGICLAGNRNARTPMLTGASILGIAAVATVGVVRADVPGTGSPPPLPNEADASAIFRPLHENIYRSFDHTSESKIYDALARSVDGELLANLYAEVFDQLVQTEEQGKIGVVTGLTPLEFSVSPASFADDDPDTTLTFGVRHRWQVEGTVYHWGHSHTRLHEYEAEYTVAARDVGWRITDQTILSQRRLDVDQTESGTAVPDEVQRLLQRLGTDDI